ncbi:circadian-associated transcriptional repressor [Dryobates pubescens]|uniref:circadian-associated transcriptional repressor n=1 Tax=Dryobates pubescens TaxID=118200 RepID=UPI0023B8FD5C|nr:circadian-associated transcriptional repressor [Dryobates pubescens]
MEPSAHSCSCGSPASSLGGPSHSEAEAGGPLPAPSKPERSHKRPGGPGQAAPPVPSSPYGGKRPRKGEGGDAPPSDGDHLFAQKCQELRVFIHPLAELLEGLKRGRYDRGLSSFQQSVAMDRIQRIIGVLQKPEMGARYLGTLLQVEGMLRVWFPHVNPTPARDAAPISALRRRPPAGPPGAPRCRRPPEDAPSSTPEGAAPEASGTSRQEARPRCHRPAQTGTPASPPPPDVPAPGALSPAPSAAGTHVRFRGGESSSAHRDRDGETGTGFAGGSGVSLGVREEQEG